MWVLSAPGKVGGGTGVLHFWPAVVAVAIQSLIVIALALRTALSPEQTAAPMGRRTPILSPR
jgi:hypothetical protein